jgi:hypothetical protein
MNAQIRPKRITSPEFFLDFSESDLGGRPKRKKINGFLREKLDRVCRDMRDAV